jgi:hypothetical protein
VHAALAMEMAGMEPAEPLGPGERSTLDLTRELMFTSDARFGGTTTPRWVLVRDDRALALPRGGAVTAPFVDGDGDGIADVDDLGRFIESGGYGMQPRQWLVDFGMFWLRAMPRRAMFLYNYVFMPIALKLQQPLTLSAGTDALTSGIHDEVLLVCRRRATF